MLLIFRSLAREAEVEHFLAENAVHVHVSLFALLLPSSGAASVRLVHEGSQSELGRATMRSREMYILSLWPMRDGRDQCYRDAQCSGRRRKVRAVPSQPPPLLRRPHLIVLLRGHHSRGKTNLVCTPLEPSYLRATEPIAVRKENKLRL